MLDSIIRTVVPVIVGVLLGQAARIGFDLPEGAVTEVATVVVTGVYYALGRLVEQWQPALGRVLLSLGLSRRVPAYIAPGSVPSLGGRPLS